jgi:hypothetical protein
MDSTRRYRKFAPLGQDSVAVNDNTAQIANSAVAMIQLPTGKIPTVAAIKAMYGPMTQGGQPDIIVDNIYDSAALVTTSTNNAQQLFTTVRNNRALSNIGVSGQLQSQEAFYIVGIRFEFFNAYDGALDFGDLKETLRQGYYALHIGNKPYNAGYLLWFLNPQSPLLVNTRYYTTENCFKTWLLPQPIALPPSVSFDCEYTLTAPAFQTNSWYIRCILSGYRYRSVQ